MRSFLAAAFSQSPAAHSACNGTQSPSTGPGFTHGRTFDPGSGAILPFPVDRVLGFASAARKHGRNHKNVLLPQASPTRRGGEACTHVLHGMVDPCQLETLSTRFISTSVSLDWPVSVQSCSNSSRGFGLTCFFLPLWATGALFPFLKDALPEGRCWPLSVRGLKSLGSSCDYPCMPRQSLCIHTMADLTRWTPMNPCNYVKPWSKFFATCNAASPRSKEKWPSRKYPPRGFSQQGPANNHVVKSSRNPATLQLGSGGYPKMGYSSAVGLT